jgi:hypothetical protein
MANSKRDSDIIGKVQSVDTGNITVKVDREKQSALILGTVFNVLLNIFLSFPLLSSNVPTKFTFMIFSTRESGSLLSSILSATAFLIILEIKPKKSS